MADRRDNKNNKLFLNKNTFDDYIECCDVYVAISHQIRGLLHDIKEKIKKSDIQEDKC